jgi:hypothetical protein
MGRKKVALISIFLVIIISIPSFFYIEYKSKLSISNNLIKEYLNSYKLDNKKEDEKLLDYRINKLTLDSKNIIGTDFSFTVRFSVQAVNSNSVWFAGNGTLGNNGWIDDKYKEVTVVKEKGKYIIKTIGVA